MDVPLPAGPPFFRFSDAAEASRSMTAVGFADPTVETVPLVWRLTSGEALFEAFLQGAVRTAALLRGQTTDAMGRSAARSWKARNDTATAPHSNCLWLPS